MNTIGELLAVNAQRHAALPAFIEGSNVVTHAEHEQTCASLAAGLHHAGLHAGDRIALLAHNSLAFVQLFGAASRLGIAVSAINWRLSAAEVAQVIASDQPSIVFAGSALAPLLHEVLSHSKPRPRIVAVDAPLEGYEKLRDFMRDAATVPHVIVSPDAPAVFIHTAWTDGHPKAAMLTHRNLLVGAAQLRDMWQLGADDVHLCVLPLFHITALTLALACTYAGGCSVLHARFDPVEAIHAIERYGATVLGEFAPMLDMLLQQPDAAARLASLRHLCGLDSPEVISRFESLCPRGAYWVVYGQSEAGGLVTMAPFGSAAGSVGRALPQCTVRIVDEQDQPLPASSTGEIVVRGSTVFAGYWGRPADTAKTLRKGWLHTGDAGKLDVQGQLFYVGRMAAKELIKSGGENVYPAEVEKVLREHPAVADVAVIGVPDARWGESVRAVCVARMPVDAQVLIDHVGARIAAHKRPRSVVFTDQLPSKADGSHDREKIKAIFA